MSLERASVGGLSLLHKIWAPGLTPWMTQWLGLGSSEASLLQWLVLELQRLELLTSVPRAGLCVWLGVLPTWPPQEVELPGSSWLLADVFW